MNRIFIVEDEIIVAKDLAQSLKLEGYDVVGIATTYQKASEQLPKVQVDLILCDINLGAGKSGLDLMDELSQARTTPFIFISAYSDLNTIRRASQLAPESYLTKPFSTTQLITSIRLVLDRVSREVPPTPRELAIVQALSQGLATKEIATLLEISPHTVETHRKNLLRKYEVQSSAALLSLAVSQNWIRHQPKR
jgi:DNA-binding NarL/FixJ family response regulator